MANEPNGVALAKAKKNKPALNLTILPIDQPGILTPAQLLSRQMGIKYIQKETMVQGVHYGKIPGCAKDSLYKAGAEVLCSVFNLGMGEPIIDDKSTDDEIRYRVCVKLFSRVSGKEVGTGIGECSSKEEKYQWRRLVCPEEWDDTAPDRRKEKWEAKKGKDGWKVKDKDGNYVGVKIKMVRTNPSDLANTILKMSKKRGFVDAALTATGASDLFEQDLEDLEANTRDALLAEQDSEEHKKANVEMPVKKTDGPAASTQAPAAPQETPPAAEAKPDDGKKITSSQITVIESCCKTRGVALNDVVEHFELEKIADLPFSKINDVLGWLSGFENK